MKTATSSFTAVLHPEKLQGQFVSCLAYREPPARFFFADTKAHFSRIFHKIQPSPDTGSRTGIVFATRDFACGQEMYTQLKDRLRYNPPRSETEKLTLAEKFEHQRQFRKQKADLRHSLLLQVGADHVIPNAPNGLTPGALLDAVGKREDDYLISFRDLQEISACQEIASRGGFPIKELDGKMVQASLGVFWPRPDVTRLLDYAPLSEKHKEHAYDVGTGSGVLSLILAKRGVKKITATEVEMRAIQCAQGNVVSFGYQNQIEVVKADLFPNVGTDNLKKPTLIVCNPPWLPGNPSSTVERAVFDRDLEMLTGLLTKLPKKLRKPDGVAWLVYSNLVELLGFRTRRQLLDLFAQAKLDVVDQMETQTLHKRSMTTKPGGDLFAELRKDEKISLWVLKPKPV